MEENMLEKPNIKKVDRQDDSRPSNIEQLIEKYGLEYLWNYLDKIVDFTNNNNNLISQLPTMIDNAILESDKRRNPVGKIIFNTSGDNPATYLGFGTWVEWGSGRVPVGINTNDNDFDTVEKIGGEKTHTLTTDEIPSHSHTSSSNFLNYAQMGGSQGNRFVVCSGGGDDLSSVPIIKATGGGQAHNIVQPYITCYMWKRIS
jgi:hypothetical protein